MDSSLVCVKYAMGLQQGFEKKKKYMNDIKNTFYTVYKAGLLNEFESGLKCYFWRRKFSSGKQVYQDQYNRWNTFASFPLTGSWPSRLCIATTIFWCSCSSTDILLQSRFPTPPPAPFYFNLQIPPPSELLKKYLTYLNLFCIFTANLRLAPSLGQDIEFLSPTRNAWARVNSCQSLWNCVWSLLSDMKSMLEPRASTSVL